MPLDTVTRQELVAALPDLRGTLRVAGLGGRVEIWRDPEGIPHVRAESLHDLFLAQGLVHAQDRLWHMEYDRRRAYGRWAEYAGPAAVAQDVHLRRLCLADSARADYDAVNAETRAMLDAYAEGVTVFLAATRTWPIELQLLGAPPEPWRPWDSLAVFKVRHVEMGPWQAKVWRARLLGHLGPERTAWLCPGTQPNPALIVPPGAEYRGPAPAGLEVLREGAAALGGHDSWEQGSNNWVVAGSRTASGRPLVAGDPHRALEVPSVYYQNHLASPELDAIGLSFPGVPGLPHFGHNRAVAWCVTHTMADYQDLYLERFDPGDPARYRFRDEWRRAEATRETIRVRGAASIEITVTRTHHGPVLLGDPARGHAVALRYTATAEPNRTFEAFLPMLRARSAGELEEAMRPWVDPVNNLVFADVHGRIGYRTRGLLPVRSPANAWLPVPGWDGAHEWRGVVPFAEMPVVGDPVTGWVATANSRVAGPEYPHYIGLDFAQDFRTRRLVARLGGLSGATVADMAAIHADRVSIPALEFMDILCGLCGQSPGHAAPDGVTAQAYDLLMHWNGEMDGESVAATIYAALRERLMRDLFTPLLGPLAAEAFSGVPGGGVAHMTRLKARLTEWIRRDDRTLLPAGTDWIDALARALAGAVEDLGEQLGPDIHTWRWGRLHTTQPQHPLAAVFPEAAPLLNPPAVPTGGDGDTVFATGFIPAAGYGITLTSMARYVFDLGDWERSAWIVPLGASGHPGSAHYADQAGRWGECRLSPMRYDWSRIRAEAETHQLLEPA